MRVGLITFHGSPRAPTSVYDHIKLQTFFDGAGFALCCGPRRVGRDMPVGLLLVGRTAFDRCATPVKICGAWCE